MKNKLFKATALILALSCVFGLTACKGGKPKGKLSANLTKISENALTAEELRKDKEYFFTRIAPAAGMDEGSANDFAKNDAWKVYNLDVSVHNPTKTDYTFNDLVTGDIGDGIFLLKESRDGDVSVPTYNREDIAFLAIVDSAKVSPDELFRTFNELDMKIRYYATPDDDEEEPEESKMKLLEIGKNMPTVADGKKAPVTIKKSKIEDGSEILSIYKGNEIAFSNEAKLYGLDADTAPKVVAKDSKWVCKVLYLQVRNNSDYDLTFYDITAEDNGSKGVWINRVSQYGEFDVDADTDSEIPVNVLIDPSVSEKDAEKLINELKLTVDYSITPMVDSSGQESVEMTQTAEVK